MHNVSLCNKIGIPAALEGFAEELIETAHVALKTARAMRGENPTPVTAYQELKELTEEYTDVIFYAHELGIKPDRTILKEKQERFERRWEAWEADSVSMRQTEGNG